MSSITAQQAKLYLELVPKEKRLEIGKCNGRLNPGKTQREPTFQVILDALALTPCYYAFLTTADVPEVYMHQFWILSKSMTLPTVSPEEPTRKSKRVKRPTNKSTNASTSGVVIRDTHVMSLSKKKKNMTVEKRKGIELLFEVALTEEAQYEEVRKKSLRDFHKTRLSGSGIVTKIAPNAAKIKPYVTNEGTSAKPRVTDVTEEELMCCRVGAMIYLSRSGVSFLRLRRDIILTKQSSSVSSDFASKFLFGKCNSHRLPITAILETSIVPTTTVPLIIQHEQPTPTPEPTTGPSTNLIPALPDFSSLFGFDHRVSTLENKLSQLKQVDHSAQILTSIRSQISVMDIIKDEVKSQLPHILPKEVSDFATLAAASLTEFELKKILLDKIEKSKSYQAAPEHKELYEALVKSYKLDKDLFDSYGNTYSLKRDHDDKDKDEGPFAGSDRGLKKRKTSKDVEPTKGPKTKESKSSSSKGTKSQSKSSRKSTQAEEPDFEVGNLGNDDEEPMREVTSIRDWFTKPKKPQEPTDPDWNLEYDFEECYKALSEKLDWDNPEGGDYPFDLTKPLPLVMNENRQIVPVDYFFNNDLKYLQGGILTMTYTTFTTKTKAAQYGLQGTEDMHCECSPEAWLFKRESKILTVGVESYQKKINVTKPETTRPSIKKRDPYTLHTDPQGFIYVDNQGRNRLMRSNELYKFSDGTLTRLPTLLEDITKNIQMEYLPQRRWSYLEKKRAHIMIKAIDKQLKERKMMRSLEKFIGGRHYETDLRLLQQTI
ncbi:hypothetical protein Tco_0359718 [Tanacetum coccineum]